MKETGKPLVARIYVDSGERLYLIIFMDGTEDTCQSKILGSKSLFSFL